MADTKYSKLEAKLGSEEDTEYLLQVRRRGSLHRYTPRWFISTMAFCAGMLVTIGGMRLHQSLGKSELDFLSELLKITTYFFQR